MRKKLTLAFLIAIARFLKWSCRYEFTIPPEELQKRYGPYIYALFHENLLSTILAHSQAKQSFAVIVSSSHDGDYISGPLKNLGHQTVRGSSSRDGTKALKQMIKMIRAGHPGAITVDGPRGPRHEIKDGVFQMAKLASAPIIPIACLPERAYVFRKSWDQFRLPLPFTKIKIVLGEPLYIDSNSYTEARRILSSALKELQNNAWGRTQTF